MKKKGKKYVMKIWKSPRKVPMKGNKCWFKKRVEEGVEEKSKR